MSVRRKLSLILSIVIILTSCFGCYSLRNDNVDEYLEKNHTNIILDNNFNEKNFELLNSSLNKNDIFLAGEGHGIKINYDLQFSLLTYFNKAAGVKYLLIETGYGISGLINKYLETGNEEILDYIYAHSKGAFECNKESYNFWKRVRAYNSTLPSEKRIKAIGIDMERPLVITFKYLQSLIPDYNTPAIISDRIQSLKTSLDNVQYLKIDDVKQMVESLKKDVESNKDAYIHYFSVNFFDFNYILDNILNTIHSVADESKEYERREHYMFDNFTKVYNYLPKGKYFGQFGLEHILQGEYESHIGKFDRLAKRMSKNNESPVKNKVISIAYEYKDCYRMEGDKELPAGYNFYDTNVLNQYAKEDIAIFKLNSKNSPYKNRVYFMKESTVGTTLDYFQYIILIKNSRGTTPFHS